MSAPEYLLGFALGPTELIILMVLMVFIFGPKRIPEIGEAVGKALNGFRKATKEDDKAKELESGDTKAAG